MSGDGELTQNTADDSGMIRGEGGCLCAAVRYPTIDCGYLASAAISYIPAGMAVIFIENMEMKGIRIK